MGDDMRKVNLYLDYLKIIHNGEPEALNLYFRERKNRYVVKASLFSPGHNKDQPVEGAAAFNKIEEEKYFKSNNLEERHLLSCQVGSRVELNVSVFYIEHRSLIAVLFEKTVGYLAVQIFETLIKLDFMDIIKLPVKILPFLWKAIQKGSAENELIYEIGKGKLECLNNGISDIELIAECVKRPIMYWDGKGYMKRKEFEMIPKGRNGLMKIEVEDVL